MPGADMAAAEPKIGSLCSGVGGLDLGVQSVLGGRIAWHAETNPHATKVLSRHWPDVPNLGDVRNAAFADAEPVDILTAGIPCQDLSVAGPRTGLAGARSGLWRYIPDAIPILNPRLVVIENVRGLLSTRAGATAVRPLEPGKPNVGDVPRHPRMRALGVLLGDLADRGYDSAWVCVRASDVGAPHRRSRVFVVGWPATPGSGRPVVEDTNGESRCDWRLPAPGQTQGGRARPHVGRRGREPAAHADLVGREGRRGHDPEAQRRHEPADSRHSPACWWGDYLPAIRRWECVTDSAAPSPTVPGTRRLSAAFVEWMMGLPEGWVTAIEGLSRAAQLHLLGNSVVPRQAAHAIETLAQGWSPHVCPQQGARP